MLAQGMQFFRYRQLANTLGQGLVFIFRGTPPGVTKVLFMRHPHLQAGRLVLRAYRWR